MLNSQYTSPDCKILEIHMKAIIAQSTTKPELGDPGLGGGGWM